VKEFLRFSLLAILLAPFAWADQNSTLIEKVTAGDASGNDHFGSAVSQWGNYLAVGAKDADETTLYWVEDNGSLIELATLTPPDGGANSQFGVSVFMTDGIIAVGAKWSDHDGHSNSGAAYLYQVVPDGTVHYLHKVTAHDANATDYFGTSVSFSHGILAVGAPSDNHSGHTDAGSAYLYRLEHNGSLSPLGKVTASDANASDEFGYSVSQSGDLLVVGAWGDDHEGGSNAGSAYLFQLEQNESVTELGKVTASDASANDHFGRSVSLFGDTFAVGAYLHDPDGLNTAGAAYLFHLEQNGSISYLDKIKDAPAGSTFGNSLSMWDDLLIVGAYQETHDGKADAGAVYLYRVEHNGSATLLNRIVSHDANVSDEFGFAVSLSDGLLAVGAQNADHGGGTDAGAVYVFDIDRAANRPPVDIRPDPFLGFSPEKEELIHNLQTGWLKATEDLVFNAYGWTVDASDDWNVTVHEDGDEPSPVHFAFDVDENGQLVVNSLEFHMPALQPYLEASMGKFLLAREMCRMLMTKNSYYGDITGDGVSSGDWFKLGLMDFLVGADDRVLDILGAEPTDSEIDALLAEVGDGERTVTDQQIAAACLAVRYLDFKLKGAGKTGGVKHMTQWMKTQYENGAGAANSGINHYIYYESGGFSLTEFKGTAGRDFVKNHVLPKLDNDDTGSVLGGDVTGGPALFWHAVVPDVHGAPQSNVLYEVDEWANVLEFEEGSPVGTVVGRFNAIDPDDPQIGWKGYELIDNGSNITWTDAKAAAAAADAADPFHWVYLATVTSEAEHNLTAHLVAQAGLPTWLGASDSAVEGEWRWTEGPEGQEADGQGLQFWEGNASGNPVNGLFSNWGSIEPNSFGNEDYLKLRLSASTWGDVTSNNPTTAFLLESDQVLTHVFSLVSGEGDTNNDLFVLEADGTLRTEYVLDYESDATFYQIRVRATDELNASFEKSFWVDLLDVNEDPDGDGLHNDVDLDDDGDGYPDTEEDSAGSNPLNAWSLPPVTKIIYVDLDADGEKNGTSWANAYDNLQVALAEADGINHIQIWVAEGVYRPDVGPGQTAGDRNSTFQLKNRTEIIGGFQGHEQNFEERSLNGFITYLSGDVGAHNWPDDNVYHVVTASGVDKTAILLDLGIGRGRADGPTEWDKRGAGMLANNGSPSLRHLLFFDNHAVGLNSGGGGLCVYNGGSPAVFSCVFEANSADWGGAVKLSAGSSAIFYNALMLRNQADINGGAMVVWGSNASIIHSTIIDNNASNGGALYLGSEANASVVNSIVWDNHATSYPNLRKDAQSNLYPDHSIIQGSLGDLPDGDPLFVDPAFNDLRLRLGSPAIDAGNPAQVGALPVGYGGVNRTHDAGPDLGAYEGGVDAVNLGGLVSYSGLIDTGPYRVWLMDEHGNRIKDVEMEEPDSFSFVVDRGRSYKVKAFRDAGNDGWPSTVDPWDYHDHNPIQINETRNDFDVSLHDRDSDEDGFLDLHEVDANTNPNDANSRPGLGYGLIAHWTFDETEGTVLHDSSGNDVHGTMNGFTDPWSAGRVGGSLYFDGVDDYVSFPGATQLDDLQPFSFAGWIKLDQGGSGYVVAKRSESTGYWRLFSSSTTHSWLVRKTTGTPPALTADATTPFLEWRHLAMTWDGSLAGDGMKFYLNGEEVVGAQKTPGTGELVSDANNLFTIGNRPQNNSSYFKGWLDDFHIWNRVISPEEVDAVANPIPPDENATVSGEVFYEGPVPGPVIVWVFDEEGQIIREQVLAEGPGDFSFTLPKGQAYDLKAFRDGNGNGQLDAHWEVGEPFAHHGDWNSSTDSYDMVFVDENLTGVDIAITWHGDHDEDGITDWEEYVAGLEEEGGPSGLWAGMLAEYFLDGNASDDSGNNLHGVVHGALPGTNRFGEEGMALFFDGEDDYVQLPPLGLGSEYTLSVWILPDEEKGGGYFNVLSNNGDPVWGVREGNLTQYLFGRVEGSPVERHEWTHLVLVRDGETHTLYKNGELDATTNALAGDDVFSVIGAYLPAAEELEDRELFHGMIDDLLVWGRALPTEEVVGLHEIETLSLNRGLIGFYLLDGNESNEFDNANQLVVHGAEPGKNRFGEEGMALEFDGEDDYVQLQPLELGSEYTLSVWILPDEEKGGGYFNILSNNGDPVWGVREGNLKQYLFGRVEGSPVERHEWTHLILVRDGETHTLYKNGELDATANALAGDDVFSIIGAYLPAAEELADREPFHGMIDDLIVWDRALSQDEVELLHDFETQSPEGHEGGEEHEEGEPNGHEEAFVPIVRTYHHEEESNGVYWFGGQVLADGGSPVLEAGVLVSRSIFFEDAIRLPGEMDPENNQFLVITDDLEKGTRYYYRAYARNAVGENVGSIKKLVTGEHPGAWWSDMPEVGVGWRASDWFGEFRKFEQTDWIYHAKLGWVFVVPDEERGLWLWHRELGWLWTQKGTWPHLWRNEVSAWIYFLKNHQGRAIIYDYGTSDYLILP
jgi:hypothetical protein